MTEHAVIVRFEYAADQLDDLHQLERVLEAAIESAEVGEYDGHDISVDLSDGTLYMYGPDADALYAGVRQTLLDARCLKGQRIVLRYGPPEDGVVEREITLGEE